MSAATDFIKNKPLISYFAIIVACTSILIVVIAMFRGDIREELSRYPTKQFVIDRVDSVVGARIIEYDSLSRGTLEPKLDTIIKLMKQREQ